MKLFTAAQIRTWDAYTITQEPIASIALMERASAALVRWWVTHYNTANPVLVVAGMGNNGGDGLAVARMLRQRGYAVSVWIVAHSAQGSPDWQINARRWQELDALHWVYQVTDLPTPPPHTLLVDALLGSGLNRPAEGLLADTIRWMNESGLPIISVDIASGLQAEGLGKTAEAIIRPQHTLTLQTPKLAMLLPDNELFVGKWHCLDIGLHPEYSCQTESPYHVLTDADIAPWWHKRALFSHKGTYGHALLIAGSKGKIGAAALAAEACLRAGVGLLTVHLPACGLLPLQTQLPEAMISPDEAEDCWQHPPDTQVYKAIAIGPGLGQAAETLNALEAFLSKPNLPPLVLDADALNLLAQKPTLLTQLPPYSILTPHPKEFERLAGKSTDSLERLNRLCYFAKTYQAIVLLKGRHTAIATPQGQLWFNNTGNPGMATAGSGDVLTGIITALLAQGYSPMRAACLGVYVHGAAGDAAAQQLGQAALLASDIISATARVFKQAYNG
jgi:NAD(P)H-hydrate epimerase